MELFFILLRQLIMMALFMMIGYCLYRTKKVTKETCSALNSLLLYVALPAAIINSYITERTREKLNGFLLALVLSAAAMLISIITAILLYKKKRVEMFGVSYSNAGFMGIPIVSAVAGAEAVFYVAPFVMWVNVLQWTAGVIMMTGDRKAVQPKKLLSVPVLYAAVIGMLLFLTQIPIPSVVKGAVSSLAACNGPLAMVILGIYFAQVDIKGIFSSREYYLVTAARLIVIPVLTGLFLLAIPAQPLMRLVIFIAAAAPIGSNVSIFASIYGRDYKAATQEVCLTTLCSIFTMPVLAALFSYLAGYSGV